VKTTTIWFILGESCFATYIDGGTGYTDKAEAEKRLEECRKHAHGYYDPTRLSLYAVEVEI
jgi:hypothetical protein